MALRASSLRFTTAGFRSQTCGIFKSQFYKYFSSLGRKDEFIEHWKALEETATDIFHRRSDDELLTRCMYYRRACKISTTTRRTISSSDSQYFKSLKNPCSI